MKSLPNTAAFLTAGLPRAVAPDITEEIRFLTYRLEVLAAWPNSPGRESRMAATRSRLNDLLPVPLSESEERSIAA
jgi:hypothetical protein